MLNATDLVRDLQEMRDQGFLSDALLRKAVRAVADSDERYDWAGAFLLRDDGATLWLHNYVGDPAEYAELPVGSGIWGSAVADKANRRVDDVTKLEDYTPCNPDVLSEMVVLIRAGDDIFGGITLGSEQSSAFKDEDDAALESVTAKLAEQIAAERR